MPVWTGIARRRVLREGDPVRSGALHEERHRAIENRHRLQKPNPGELFTDVDIESRPKRVAMIDDFHVAVVMEVDIKLVLRAGNENITADRATRSGPAPISREPLNVARERIAAAGRAQQRGGCNDRSQRIACQKSS